LRQLLSLKFLLEFFNMLLGDLFFLFGSVFLQVFLNEFINAVDKLLIDEALRTSSWSFKPKLLHGSV